MNIYLSNIELDNQFVFYLFFLGEKLLFAKGAESSILPKCIGGEIAKTRIHVDEFALVSKDSYDLKKKKLEKYTCEKVEVSFFQQINQVLEIL